MSTLAVRVYWEDTDAGGVVYHASYLRFMERGRTEFLRECGVHQAALQDETGLTFVVADMNIRFRQPARLDDVLVVETVVEESGGASLSLRQTVLRGQDVIVEADVTCAVISRDGKPMRIPADVKAKLA
ncbi:tol-pal system-associated acyl-CoA thioesterase [Terrihabitans soli]|uniref:Tol-pal system-associated acyl-CoA thioesterase n=1 Tax=Terrihabitans soli TaxID=708113 RepID=A0A6S6QTT6_9HYPH|nr:tol-pal system-associated acyl-CoA thioesterase [Terrihabitans soli]BCJ89878.1 tol-pal system-associated acyl-CoA thioesterase [Terrihabitans soli]